MFILIVFNHHLFLNEDYQDLSKKFLHFAASLHFLFIIANAPSKNADRAGKSNERRKETGLGVRMYTEEMGRKKRKRFVNRPLK